MHEQKGCGLWTRLSDGESTSLCKFSMFIIYIVEQRGMFMHTAESRRQA